MSDTDKAILDAAMMMFAEKGFTATTTRQIAQRAGVNEVTLFRHFHSKGELFHRILEEIQRLYPPLMETDALSRAAPEALIEAFVRLTLLRLHESPYLVRLLFYALLDEVAEIRDALIEKRLLHYRDLLRGAFARLQAEGAAVGSASPEEQACLLMSQVFGLATMSLCRDPAFRLDEVERLTAQVMEHFVSRKAPRRPEPRPAGRPSP